MKIPVKMHNNPVVRITALFISLLLLGNTLHAQKKNSKYPDGVEINKGMFFTTLSFSMSARDAENEQQLLNYYIEQKRSGLQVRLDPGYIIKKNLGVGVGFMYGYSKNYNTQKGTDGSIIDNKTYARNFNIRPFVKNFLPIGKSKKFYIIIPTELQFGYGTEIKESVSNGQLTRTYNTKYSYGIEMRPGLLAFIVENFGFEVNVGAFGLSSSVEKITTTGQPDTKVVSNDLDLKINLLQLSLGFCVYF